MLVLEIFGVQKQKLGIRMYVKVIIQSKVRERVREGEGKRETERERSTQFGRSINGPYRRGMVGFGKADFFL